MKKILFLLGAALLTLSVYSCSDDGPSGPDSSDFDRQAMLENWADNIIIPAFESFSEQTALLKSAAGEFSAEPSQQTLDEIRNAWESAYLSFQHVSMFEMGRAMELRFRENLNTYPTDAAEIDSTFEKGSYNIELPSLTDSQGFPALDYLLYGLGDTDPEILSYYTDNAASENYRTFLLDIATRIDALTQSVTDHWANEYRDAFVANSGGGANASVDRMVNDYIFYYEKALRAGKVGIPAGVFSVNPLSSHVEAYYRQDLSKDLLLEALEAAQNFFNGVHFNSGESGESLSSYLDYLNTIKNGADLNSLINEQFETAREEIETLDVNFAQQIESDNSSMLTAYDELQKNVVLLKVDMLQALNISVDYVDADGD